MPQNGCTGSPQRGVEFNLGTPPISPWHPPSVGAAVGSQSTRGEILAPALPGSTGSRLEEDIDRSIDVVVQKAPHKSSSSSSKKQRAGADEEARLVDALSERKPTRKEIESTEPGGAPTVIERTLPSFFDFYPRAKRAYDALKKKGPAAARLELLRACETVLTTGNADAMGKLVKAAPPARPATRPRPSTSTPTARTTTLPSAGRPTAAPRAGWTSTTRRTPSRSARARPARPRRGS